MAKNVAQVIDVRAGYQVRRGAIKQESVLGTQYIAIAIYDTALNDSAGVSNKTVAAHGLGVFLPNKAIVVRALYQTVTTFTSGGSATIALKVQSANDLKTATAYTDGSFTAATLTDCAPAHSAATSIALTAERELTATVATAALTAGKLVLYVEYMIGA
jgi:hypothetical protein